MLTTGGDNRKKMKRNPKRLPRRGMLLCLCLLLTACSRPGMQVEYAGEGESITAEASPAPEGSISPEIAASPAAAGPAHSAAPASLPPHWGKPPFDQWGFAMDSYGENSAQSGKIYSPLPDGSVVKLELRYRDGNGDDGTAILYQTAKNESVDYAFLPPPMPPQYVKLTAFWIPQEEGQPQPDDVLALFGPRGENLPMPPAQLGSYGQQMLMEAWVFPWPDEAQARQAVESALAEALPGELLSARWSEGVYQVFLSAYAAALSPAQREQALDAAQTAAEAFYPYGEEKLNPATEVYDAANALLARRGQPMPEKEVLTGDLADPVHISGGERYHKESCRYAQGGQIVSRFAADMEGYTPCKVCNP